MQRPNRVRMRPRIPSEKPVVGGILKIHHSESGSSKNRNSMSWHAFAFLKQSRFLKQNPMLGGNFPAASCVVSRGHPSVAGIFHREKFTGPAQAGACHRMLETMNLGAGGGTRTPTTFVTGT